MDSTGRSRSAFAFCAALCCGFLLLPSLASAAIAEVSVTPVVIDGKGKVRDILRYTVTLENTSTHLVTIYPWVTDVDVREGQSGVSDLGGAYDRPLGESLARWIEVTRSSVDLLPGEKKEIPLTVQINLNAKPGQYHAAVHLSKGSDRASAEASSESETITLNIEVLEEINERLQLASFAPTKNIFSDKTALFNYKLENVGNRGEVPRGTVRIFDRDGREVAIIEANSEGERLEPSAQAMLSAAWAAGGSFGRYKAMLDLEYGNRGTIQDTVFFWMVPWGKLIGMFLSLMLASVIVAVMLHSRYAADRRMLAMAHIAPVDTPRRSKLKDLLGGILGDDEDDEAEGEYDEPATHHAVSEMREVTYPQPIHTRLPAPVSEEPVHPKTRLSAPAHHDELPSAHHRVTLRKREHPAPPPHHVVNLRK